MTVRRATTADLPRILEMRRRSFEYGKLAELVGPYDEDHFYAVFANALDSHSARLLVAELDGAVVGVMFTVLADVWLAPSLTCATEAFIWVEPEARGLGVGKTLVEAVEQWAREHGAQFVGLHSYPDLDPQNMRRLCAARDYDEMQTAYMRRVA